MKRIYNISYDLNKTGKDYQGLYKELKNTYEWNHPLDSTWLLFTAESPNQIWDRVRSHIDKDDNILIAEITTNYSGWLPKDVWTWISQRIPQTIYR